MNFSGAVISVGGSHRPIAVSLGEAKPRFVLFVVSEQSKPEIEGKILPLLTYTPQYNCVAVPDPGDLAACYGASREAIPKWLAERSLTPEQVYVDITGATKPMSAALALAGVERFSQFSYVSGRERDKAGLGVVVSGTEEVLRTVNPWDRLASRERERANWLFRSYYAEPAAEQLRRAAQKCSPELQQELTTLAELADCFARADRFQFGDVYGTYRQVRDQLNLILSHRDQVSSLGVLDRLAEHWKNVEEERRCGGAAVSATLGELLANADRRSAQGRYDDAIARLYRATELFAQGKLYEAFGARLGRVSVGQIPQECLDGWRRTFGEGDEGVHLLGVQDGFKALTFSREPELQSVAGRYGSIHNHLQKRNNSILAHGLQPGTEAAFKGFWAALLSLVDLTEEQIPRWPRNLEF
jgi:CRISPR-associated protein (TIGR02710 family)